LRETRKKIRLVRFEGEKMQNLRDWYRGSAHLTEHRGVWLGRGVVLNPF
jgi:hypothetical protein